jgi:cytochrome c oxidase subunit 1
MLFAIGLVSMFTIGGISGVSHSSPPADLQQTDTYYIVAHFHYVLFGGSLMGLFAGIYFYFPKMYGRMMDERLGKWHFWLNFIGGNLTFFPMHFSGLLGMPRRIYQYDAGQGYEPFNMASTIGYGFLFVSMLFFIYNFFKSRKSGTPVGNDPWGAGTLEWSIPSPPPEYNFAELPNVTSRYPLWDVKSPRLTAEVPHSERGDTRVDVAAGGSDVAHGHTGTTDHNRMPAESTGRIERGHRTAKELGIPMPSPSIKPLVAALGLTIMISGMLFTHLENKTPFYTLVLGGATILVTSLYAWLTTPLEEEH